MGLEETVKNIGQDEPVKVNPFEPSAQDPYIRLEILKLAQGAEARYDNGTGIYRNPSSSDVVERAREYGNFIANG